ncbi:MAG TPA: carboxylesterase family protein [Chryseolinea sp.]
MKNIKNSFLVGMIFFIPVLATSQKQPAANTPLVAGNNIAVTQTASGKVRGYIHNGIFTYKGIPYAKAERFMAPVKPDPWEGIRSSLSYGPVCPLIDPTTSVMDEVEFVFHHDWGYPNEDCLRLNVWTPSINPNDSKKRPVMVWLHGGGHTAGSSQELPSYDGENLARKGDVVIVSINHRLNVLGFLNLSAYGQKYEASPNVGMMDIVSALEWVKSNVANFGGDPSNVTIFGQSGGGGKVNTLLNAPSAKGLFHKAIIQSGGLGLKFNDVASTQRVAKAVLAELKLQPEQIDSLQKVPFPVLALAAKKSLQKVNEELKAEGKEVLPLVGLSWGPCLDGKFLPNQPTEPAAQAISSNIPLLIGSTKNEFATTLRMPQLKTASQEVIMDHLRQQYGDKTQAYISAVKKAYPDDTRPTDLIDVDALFRLSAIKMANLKVAGGTAPVYMYLFTWQSPVLDGNYKSLHCMEIPFAFDNIARCEEMTGGGKEAHALAAKVSQAWLSFARTGNPNHKGFPTWQKYTPDNGATMLLDNTCVEKYHHDKELMAIVPQQAF